MSALGRVRRSSVRALTAVIPIYGVLMDSLGRAFAMDVACFFFGFGAVFCALSTNIWWLIAARAFAGVSSADRLLLREVLTPARRRRALDCLECHRH